jgi:GNAT superfamily N-acetyltransferase
MNITFRQATIEDLRDIIRMLADDFLGQQRERLEDPLPESYIKAFREIDADPNNELIVALQKPALQKPARSKGIIAPDESAAFPAEAAATPPTQEVSEMIVGTLQLTFTPSLSHQGGKRCTAESVRVDEKFRGQGIGREMMLWAIERAKEKGCIAIQLTTHSERKNAHRFYANLGFTGSHLGMKLKLK